MRSWSRAFQAETESIRSAAWLDSNLNHLLIRLPPLSRNPPLLAKRLSSYLDREIGTAASCQDWPSPSTCDNSDPVNEWFRWRGQLRSGWGEDSWPLRLGMQARFWVGTNGWQLSAPICHAPLVPRVGQAPCEAIKVEAWSGKVIEPQAGTPHLLHPRLSERLCERHRGSQCIYNSSVTEIDPDINSESITWSRGFLTHVGFWHVTNQNLPPQYFLITLFNNVFIN